MSVKRSRVEEIIKTANSQKDILLELTEELKKVTLMLEDMTFVENIVISNSSKSIWHILEVDNIQTCIHFNRILEALLDSLNKRQVELIDQLEERLV